MATRATNQLMVRATPLALYHAVSFHPCNGHRRQSQSLLLGHQRRLQQNRSRHPAESYYPPDKVKHEGETYHMQLKQQAWSLCLADLAVDLLTQKKTTQHAFNNL